MKSNYVTKQKISIKINHYNSLKILTNFLLKTLSKVMSVDKAFENPKSKSLYWKTSLVKLIEKKISFAK